MKQTLLALLTLLVLPAHAQWHPPARTPKPHTILCINVRHFYLIKVTEGDSLIVGMKNGDTLHGDVKRIRQDTLFLMDTAVRVSSVGFIDVIPVARGNTSSTTTSAAVQHIVVDPLQWDFVFPPEKVYLSTPTYDQFIQQTLKPMRLEKRRVMYDPLKYRNFIKFNLTRIFHLELSCSYEFIIRKPFTWETEISYIFGLPTPTGFFNNDHSFYSYDGFSVYTGPRYYFRRTSYLSPVIFYRYLYADGLRTSWPNDSEDEFLQDQYQSDFGFCPRIGQMKRYHKFILDMYFGVGFKYMTVVSKEYGYYPYETLHWWHEDHSPIVYTYYMWRPAVNAGIKIGFGF